MNVTADNICDIMSADFYTQCGFKFQGDVGWRDEIAKVCGYGDGQFAPLKLRAMWAYYITDPDEKKHGASIARFTHSRTLMKFAVKVFVKRDGSGGANVLYPLSLYRCANFYNGCGACDEIAMGVKDGNAPDTSKEPCYQCQGDMMRLDLWTEAFIGGRLHVKQLAAPLPLPVPIEGKEQAPVRSDDRLGDVLDELVEGFDEGVEEYFF